MKTDFLTAAFQSVRLRFHRRSGPDEAEDSPDDNLQEAFCRLWTQRHRISDKAHAEGLLMTTARNIHTDNIRRMAAHPQYGLPDAYDVIKDPEDTEDISETYRHIESLAAANLSSRDREILFHRDRDGWEFDELASFYGISEANVRMIVSRCRKVLRNIYRQNNYE